MSDLPMRDVKTWQIWQKRCCQNYRSCCVNSLAGVATFAVAVAVAELAKLESQFLGQRIVG
jgi:hypothetical protein